MEDWEEHSMKKLPDELGSMQDGGQRMLASF